MSKYPDNALADSVLNSRTSRRLLEEKAPVNDFGRTVPSETRRSGSVYLGVVVCVCEVSVYEGYERSVK